VPISCEVGRQYQREEMKEEDQGPKAERWLKINVDLISGSLAGLSLLFQTPENRKTIPLPLHPASSMPLQREQESRNVAIV